MMRSKLSSACCDFEFSSFTASCKSQAASHKLPAASYSLTDHEDFKKQKIWQKEMELVMLAYAAIEMLGQKMLQSFITTVGSK